MAAATQDEEVPKLTDLLVKHKDSIQKIIKEMKDKNDDFDKIFEREDIDVVVLRFWVGYQENWDEVISVFQKTIDWRREYETWNVTDSVHPGFVSTNPNDYKIHQHYPYRAYHKTAKNSYTVTFGCMGRMRPYEIMNQVNPEEHKKLLAWNLTAEHRELNKISRRNNRIEKVVLIVDLQGVTKDVLAYKDYMQLDFSWPQLVNPESLKLLAIINIPWIFSVGWKFVKPWLHPIVLAKTKIWNAEETKVGLKSLFNDEDLPDFLGGKCHCGNDGGYCIADLFPNNERKVTVSAGSEDSVRIHVPANRTVNWKVKVYAEGTEIYTSFMPTEEESKAEIVNKVCVGKKEESGQYVTNKAGFFILTMSAKSSRWSSMVTGITWTINPPDNGIKKVEEEKNSKD